MISENNDNQINLEKKDSKNLTSASSKKNREKETVFTTSLGSIVAKCTDNNNGNIDNEEALRRKWLTQNIIRYASEKVSELNVVGNLFITLYFQYILEKQIPFHTMINDSTFWNWCVDFCSCLKGKWTP